MTRLLLIAFVTCSLGCTAVGDSLFGSAAADDGPRKTTPIAMGVAPYQSAFEPNWSMAEAAPKPVPTPTVSIEGGAEEEEDLEEGDEPGEEGEEPGEEGNDAYAKCEVEVDQCYEQEKSDAECLAMLASCLKTAGHADANCIQAQADCLAQGNSEDQCDSQVESCFGEEEE